MQKILLIGAGLSSSYLIKYLLANAKKENWQLTIADASLENAVARSGKNKLARTIEFDVNKIKQREKEISDCDIVISLLPPALHIMVAKDCLKFKKHLVTASYVSEEMKKLHIDVLKSDILFINEIGLDPGIDHLSAAKMIHDIKHKGGTITSFKSYTGGLVAPEFDDNPWNYKFTWNPRNVVLAGKATAAYKSNGMIKYTPAWRLFSETEEISVNGYGKFESYANRDSLSYIEPYGISDAKTVLRGTLRKKGFCTSWNNIVKLGLNDDSVKIHCNHKLTYRQYLCSFINSANEINLESELCHFLNIKPKSKEFKKLKWLGLLENTIIPSDDATPADIFLQILLEKWKLKQTDLDMIVMKHEISYKLNGKNFKAQSSLVVKGEDSTYTAMAKTVGLPMAMATKLILKNQIKARGVQIPITDEFYNPILKELEKYGVKFSEH